MHRRTPSRNPHASTADLLSWPESQPPQPPQPPVSAAAAGSGSHQPPGGVSKVVFGGEVTDEEAQDLFRRKPCSSYKQKEMTGSGIFTHNEDDNASESGGVGSNVNKTGVRVYQQALSGISQICFSAEESVTHKKPTSITEVAKQRELSGTLQSESDMKDKKQLSNAKSKELSGHDIFGPPPEIPSRSSLAVRTQETRERSIIEEPAQRSVRTSVRVSNPAGGPSNIFFSEEPEMKAAKKIHDQKFQELTGNDIFKGNDPPGSAEKSLSKAKLREMRGSDIFADGTAGPRGYFGGVRKPPGGGSSINLILEDLET
ncbi:hypothetical protein AKJ16_DCAP00304 [Drosera capensis]